MAEWPSFLIGGGRAADTIVALDWSKTSLGPIHNWSPSLRTALGIVLQSRFPKALVWGADLVTFHNDAFEPILGEKPSAIGRGFDDVWSEIWTELEPIVANTFAGEATFTEDFPLVIDRHGYPEQAFFTFCYSPIRDESGKIAGIMDTVIETTKTVLAQRQLAMMNGELSHRMRNLLTMFGAVADASLRTSSDIMEARASLQQRLSALSHAQSVLVADKNIDASVAEIVDQALAPHGSVRERFKICDVECRLNSQQSLSLALALNELITNSIKYGALSNHSGTIEIEWVTEKEAGERFRFVRKELGIAREGMPTRQGFGTKVLTQFVPAAFHGKARLEFEAECLLYEVTAPAAAVCKGEPEPEKVTVTAG